MDIEQRIDDITRTYKSLQAALSDYLQPPNEPKADDEHLEDLVLLRDTGLSLLGGLVNLKESDEIPFDIDVNELSLTIDQFITTASKVVSKT